MSIMKAALRFLLASIILGFLSIYAAANLSLMLWLIFLLVFTLSIFFFTRVVEIWTVIPSFITGKIWTLIFGFDKNIIGALVIALSFSFFFLAELKRLYSKTQQRPSI